MCVAHIILFQLNVLIHFLRIKNPFCLRILSPPFANFLSVLRITRDCVAKSVVKCFALPIVLHCFYFTLFKTFVDGFFKESWFSHMWLFSFCSYFYYIYYHFVTIILLKRINVIKYFIMYKIPIEISCCISINGGIGFGQKVRSLSK